MIVEEDDMDRIGFWIGQVHLAQNLKSLSSDLSGIRRKPVRDFESVLIGLVLQVSAECAADRVRDKQKKREQEHQNRERCPVVQSSYVPGSAPSRKHQANQPVSDVEQHQQQDREKRNAFRDVLKNTICGVFIFAIVVSHTTIRFELPIPVT